MHYGKKLKKNNGQQFHQYQQNKQLPRTSSNRT